MASWEEIKKLAADLHRVQLGDSAKKLSDRNCIEVIANLIERHLINVVFSLDGKEYVTRDYLKTQIINETLANGGRIALFDLQQILNVDYQTIEIEAKHIADSSRSQYSLCLGQLISRDYFEKMYSEINEKLEECGRLTLSDITKCYDLPMDVLITEITQQLGRKIKATLDIMDNGVLYTQGYMELQASILRGALSAVTKPLDNVLICDVFNQLDGVVNQLENKKKSARNQPFFINAGKLLPLLSAGAKKDICLRYGPGQIHKLVIDLKIEPGLFFSTYDRLLNDGYIKGSISGGRVLDRAVFVPDIYIEASERFLKSFYYQNGYLELSAVKKLSADPKITLRKLLDEAESLIYLKSVVLSRELYDQIENSVHESMKKHLWVAVEASVNIPLEKSDVDHLVSLLENKHKDWTLCDRTYFYQHNLVDQFLKIFEPLCIDKASKESVNIAKLLRSTKENASIQQEITKKSKGAGAKKRKGDKNRDTDDWNDQPSANDNDQLIFMMRDELIKYLTDEFCGDDSYPVEILGNICSKLYSKLNALYREHAESIYVNTQSSNSKKGHGDFKEKFRQLYQNICLFDASTSIFNDSVSEQLKSYLLRTLCTDLVNLAISFYCHSPNAAQLTPKVRDNMIDAMASDVKVAFQKTIQSINKKNLDAFFDAVNEISAPNICSLSVRRSDKKLRSEIVIRYQMELLSQLNECQDESTGLLSACLFLISKNFPPDVMVHASGKFVPQMVQLLQDKIPKSLYQLLTENQKLVVQKLKAQNDENVVSEVKSKFEKLKQEIFDTYANVPTS